MFVVTADQIGSRRHGDRVDNALEELSALPADGLARPFERTVGDEIQGVITEPPVLAHALEVINRLRAWSIGIGVGKVEQLGVSASSSTGPAFIAAREAVEAARRKSSPMPVVVRHATSTPDLARTSAHAQGLAQLLGSVQRRRTVAGWEVIDHLTGKFGPPAKTQVEVARRLGISAAAVSERLRTALWFETEAASPLLIELFTQLGSHE